mmetsp:Transcript_122838/g.306821  ORF Transcript_122838/g.306821 Transcript_122838/m.306821 type:complete len:401 (+) Transcript_122838:13-1215(+)
MAQSRGAARWSACWTDLPLCARPGLCLPRSAVARTHSAMAHPDTALVQMTGALVVTGIAASQARRLIGRGNTRKTASAARLPGRTRAMSVVGHRGSSHMAPENTLASMDLAFKHGAQGVEFDIQRSLDGEIFLLHDDTLRRTAAIDCPDELQRSGALTQQEYESMLDRDISQLSYKGFIRHVDVGSWKDTVYANQRPPLMTDVMAQVPDGCFALCEVKGGDLATATAVVSLVAEQGWTADKLRFIGFDLELMTELKRLLVERGLEISVILLQDLYSPSEAEHYISRAVECGLDGVDFEAETFVVTPEVVRQAKDKGLQLGVWVWDKLPDSDTAVNVAAFEGLGVDFFTSDLPPEVRSWMDGWTPSKVISPSAHVDMDGEVDTSGAFANHKSSAEEHMIGG